MGGKNAELLEGLGAGKIGTVGFDPNANGRAERGVRFLREDSHVPSQQHLAREVSRTS